MPSLSLPQSRFFPSRNEGWRGYRRVRRPCAELTRSFKKDVLPLIGKKPLRHLTEKDLLAVLRSVKARGQNRTVVIRNNDIGQMLRWGEKRKPWRGLMTDGNPADLIDVSKLLDHGYEEQRDRLLSPDEIRELRNILERLEKDYEELPAGQKYSGIRPVNTRVQCALWICLSTLCRIGELLKAEWRYLDLKKGTWFIPAEATKGHKGKRQDHHVFLSAFSIAQFQRLQKETGNTPFCFPSKDGKSHVDTKTVSKLIGDRQCRFKNRTKPLAGRHHDDSLVLSKGIKGEWTPHDLRRTGATMMQELGVKSLIAARTTCWVAPRYAGITCTTITPRKRPKHGGYWERGWSRFLPGARKLLSSLSSQLLFDGERPRHRRCHLRAHSGTTRRNLSHQTQ